MALVPKIQISLTDSKCNKLKVTENTGVYVASSNDGGWGTPNIDTNAVTSANVYIYDYTGDTLLQTIILKDGTTDVFSPLVSSPTPSPFTAFSSIDWTQNDGIYKVSYVVYNGTTFFTSPKQYKLFLCNLCNCIHDLKVRMVKECSGDNIEKIKETFDQLELIKYGIESAFSCGDFATALSLLASAQKICTSVADCGCGCN